MHSHDRAVTVGWSTFSRLLRCPRLISVMPSCLQMRYSCASASSVRALVASSKTEDIKVREGKKGMGGRFRVTSEDGGCCCEAFTNA